MGGTRNGIESSYATSRGSVKLPASVHVATYIGRLEIHLRAGHWAAAHDLVDQLENEVVEAESAKASSGDMPPDRSLLDEIPIVQLQLDVRLINALQRLHIFFVGQILDRDLAYFSARWQVGQIGCSKIREALGQIGVIWGE